MNNYSKYLHPPSKNFVSYFLLAHTLPTPNAPPAYKKPPFQTGSWERWYGTTEKKIHEVNVVISSLFESLVKFKYKKRLLAQSLLIPFSNFSENKGIVCKSV